MAGVPLPLTIDPAALKRALTAISEGRQALGDAFAEEGILRVSVQYALRDGRAIGEKLMATGKITAKEQVILDFYIAVEQARAAQNRTLRRAAFGVTNDSGPIDCDPEVECGHAFKVLLLTCRELRTPWRDEDELRAIAAHAAAAAGKPTEGPPAEATPQPTEAQRLALARKMAAELGYDLTPAGRCTPKESP